MSRTHNFHHCSETALPLSARHRSAAIGCNTQRAQRRSWARVAQLTQALTLVAACSSAPAAPGDTHGAANPATGASGTGASSQPASSGAAGNRTAVGAAAGRTASDSSAGGNTGAPTKSGTSGSGPAAGAAPVGGASGAVAAGAPTSAAGASGSIAAAGSGGSSAPTGATGSLPAITDPAEPGRFTPVWKESEGPGGNYTTITPMELAQSELHHPILIWGPGAGAYPMIYKSLLDHIASHGFVIVSYNSTPQGPELNEGIDWIEAESTREGSPFFNKVDTKKIAMGGQSAGSLATFMAGGDARLTTTLHINGGTFDGNVSRLIKPALFICGDDPAVTGGDGTWESDLARPNCDRDFESIKIPVWYGVVVGSSHTTVIDNAMSGMPAGSPEIKQAYLAANAAWLRWQLAGDETMKSLFVGPSCGYCADTKTWLVQQKGLM